MLNLVIAFLVILIVPTLIGLVRRRLLTRKNGRPVEKPKPAPNPVQTEPPPLYTKRERSVYPAARDLPEREEGVQRVVEELSAAPPTAAGEVRPAFERIRNLPPFKQAVAWSEILGTPVSIRPEE
jgi:hypothetical protein